MKRNFTILSILLASSFLASAQKGTWSHSVSAGIKRNGFGNASQHVTAVNPTPAYRLENILPDVHDTYSAAFALQSERKLSDRFAFITSAGLDLQQLSVETGFQNTASSAGYNTYQREEITELYTRLKFAGGARVDLVRSEATQLSFGASLGAMLGIGSGAYSYTFVEGAVSIARPQHRFFLSASFSPYNVSLPGSGAYFGNMDADAVIARASYRITDITAGVAFRIGRR